jgi:hypothetical protein
MFGPIGQFVFTFHSSSSWLVVGFQYASYTVAEVFSFLVAISKYQLLNVLHNYACKNSEGSGLFYQWFRLQMHKGFCYGLLEVDCMGNTSKSFLVTMHIM